MTDTPTPEAVAAILKDVTPGLDRPAYLIRKHGGYYKPNCQGYTGSVILAGRYTLAQAVTYSHPNGPDGPRDGMSYIHEDDVTEPDWLAYRALAADRDAQTALVEAAEAKVAEVTSDRAYIIGANAGWEAAVEQGEATPAAAAMLARAEAAEANVAKLVEVLRRFDDDSDCHESGEWFEERLREARAIIAEVQG